MNIEENLRYIDEQVQKYKGRTDEFSCMNRRILLKMKCNLLQLGNLKDNNRDDIVDDKELFEKALIHLDDAQSCLMEMKHPIGRTLFHMANSISFYMENYIEKGKFK